MELERAIVLKEGVALEALADSPKDLGITKGNMYFLSENAKTLYLKDLPSFPEKDCEDKPCGAIFSIINDYKIKIKISYAFFRLSGTF